MSRLPSLVFSYAGRVRRWTTLGVGAIGVSGCGLMLLLSGIVVEVMRLQVPLNTARLLVMCSTAAQLFAMILGAAAIFSGATDHNSKTDARLGVITVAASGLQLMALVYVFAVAN